MVVICSYCQAEPVQLFQVDQYFVDLFAAGLVATGVHEFNEAGFIPPIIEHVWDINFILDEQSTFGSLLKALFGYNGNPTLSELLAYLVYFALVAFRISRIAPEKALAQEV